MPKPHLIEAQWQSAWADIAPETDPYERWRQLDQLVRDFNGLHADTDAMRSLAELSQSAEVRKTRDLESALASDERRFVQLLDGWVVRMSSGRFAEARRQAPPPLLTGPPRESASAQRRLELAHSAANAYVPAMPGVRADPARMAACKALAAAIFPERHGNKQGINRGLKGKRPPRRQRQVSAHVFAAHG